MVMTGRRMTEHGEHEILGKCSNTYKIFDQFCRSNTEKNLQKIYIYLQLTIVVCITWKVSKIFRTNNEYLSYVSKFG